MKEITIVALMSFVGSLQSIHSDTVQIKTVAIVPEEKTNDNNPSASTGGHVKNGTLPCDRYLRSAEIEVRNPRNHKFVTSNGWAERQRPRPEINVYSRVEELPQPPLPPVASTTSTSSFYQQQRNSLYQDSRQQQSPPARTSKRIIYYATLPDVVRPQPGYPSPSSYSTDPFALGPGPYSADFRQLDSNRNVQDGLQRNRLAPYDNVYNRGGGGVTSVTAKSVAAVYNSKYDEPAEFRDSFYRPNDFTSKFAPWAEPFYKSWSSSSWDNKELPSFNNNRGSLPFSWDREPFNRGSNSWDNRGSSWDNRGPLWDNRGSSWDNKGSSWDNRGSSWDKELVEVPLKKPNGVDGRGGDGGNDHFNSDKYPEVAVVQSGVIDVRGDRKQMGMPVAPPPRFTVIDVDPKQYHQTQQMRFDEHNKPMQHNIMQYELLPPKPMRYEAYMPMEPPTRFEQQQPPVPPSSMRYEQQYRPSSSSSTRYGQQQNQNKEPSNSYYENIKNNINTHQFMTSWTEVSTQDNVSPTHSVNVDITSLSNSTSVQNNTSKMTPHTNTTKIS